MQSIRSASHRYLTQHADDLTLQIPNLSFNVLQRAWRLVAVEISVQWDFIADFCLGEVNPGVGSVGQYFALEIVFDFFLERNALGVAQVGVWFGLTVLVAADFGGFVALAEGILNRLEFGLRQANRLVFLAVNIERFELPQEYRPVFVEALTACFAKLAQQRANRFLAALAFRDFLEPGLLVLLLARRQPAKGRFKIKPGNAFRAGLEVEAERALVSPIWSGSRWSSKGSPILLRLLPRLFRILVKSWRASMSWILPLRRSSLRLVRIQR